jgi:lysophospholipase L1-like esterase
VTRMRLTVLLVFIALLFPAVAGAGTPRILLVGDSWAYLLYANKSFPKALQESGLGECDVMGLYTAIPGSTSKQWTNPEWLQKVTDELNRNPTIDIVHVSLGGNGFLRQWEGGMSDAERDAIFQTITNEIEIVVKHILGVRDNIRVSINNYDYVNATHNSTVPELNRAGMVLSGMKRDLAQRLDRVEYIHNYGLMQYHFGIPGVSEPGQVPYPGQAPDFQPWPGGNDEYGNPPEAMLDKIHLSPEGYHVLAKHCVDVLYKNWLTGSDAQPKLAQAGSNSAKER